MSHVPNEPGLTRSFKVSEDEIAPGCLEVRVEGELDLAVAEQLQEAIARCRGKQTLISLEDCEFIDATGIAVIIHSPRAQVLRVLDTTGLTGSGFVFESREEALGDSALLA
jgi:anti-anti-sigma factor